MRKPRNVESSLRRVATLGDGFPTAVNSPLATAACLDVRRYAAEQGRQLSDDFAVCLYFNLNVKRIATLPRALNNAGVAALIAAATAGKALVDGECAKKAVAELKRELPSSARLPQSDQPDSP